MPSLPPIAGSIDTHTDQSLERRRPSSSSRSKQDYSIQPLPGFIDLTQPSPFHNAPSSSALLYGSLREDGLGDGVGKEEYKPPKMDQKMMTTYFVAGGLAGAASRTVVSPLERLKIILQVQPKSTSASSPQQYRGVFSSLSRMYAEEGVMGFFKGNGINCARIVPYSAVQFMTYEGMKSWFRGLTGEERLSTWMRLTAGAVAGTCSVVSTYPLDLVRARLSIATATIARLPTTSLSANAKTNAQYSLKGKPVLDKDLGVWGMTLKVYRTEGGMKGLYRGMVATAVGVAPYVSLNFFFYETMKTYFIPPDPWNDDLHSDIGLRTLLCGAVSGTASQTLTYPFDVLRRKMQVAGMDEYGPKYKGAWDATKQIVKSEGWFGGMYRGLWPNLLKVAPSIATSFWVYESVKEKIEDHYEKKREAQWATG